MALDIVEALFVRHGDVLQALDGLEHDFEIAGDLSEIPRHFSEAAVVLLEPFLVVTLHGVKKLDGLC
jgi:hypothetical protein